MVGDAPLTFDLVTSESVLSEDTWKNQNPSWVGAAEVETEK